MTEYSPDTATIRRWTLEIARLRSRAAKLGRGVPPAETDDLLNACMSLCESLVGELAASELREAKLTRDRHVLETDWRELFDQMPVACLEVDGAGTIIDANAAGGLLLNTTAKHLERRMLLHFAEDREIFAAFLQALRSDAPPRHTTLTLRPRERAPLTVQAFVVPRDLENPQTWLWFLATPETSLRPPRPRNSKRALAEH